MKNPYKNLLNTMHSFAAGVFGIFILFGCGYSVLANLKPTDTTVFVPGISLIKTGVTVDATGTPGDGCDSILFSFLVTNESTNGEVLENVVVTDPLLGGIIAGPVSGDLNNNTFLDPGETWVYEAGYLITQADINTGFVSGQANVDADVQGQPGTTVQDVSDNDSPNEDDDTIISLVHCQPNIAVIKTGEAIDATGGSGCDLIQYTFQVSNESVLAILENVVLDDPLLGGALAGPDSGDDNNNSFLDPGEIWIYTAQYVITPADIDLGIVENQATVSADVQGQPGVTVSDLSDNDSVLEDDITTTRLIDCQPGISVIKTGSLAIDATGQPSCDVIQYTFEVANESLVFVLENVILNDPLLGGDIAGPDAGDINNNTFLDPGEVWIYTAIYNITIDNINNGEVVNQATAIADVQGQPGETVQDLSDGDSTLEDDPTIIDISTCANPDIAMVKEGTLFDVDGDGCIESILYTFSITNVGDVDLVEVLVEDPLFGGEIPGPMDGTDVGNDGILSVDETWVYQAVYAITQQDIDNGSVVNQATVTALTLADFPVSDLSDDNSLLEDEPTRTPVPDDSCIDGSASIGLIKEGVVVDIDADGCLDSILYTFTVTNNGDIDLDEVTLEDDLLGGEIPGPVDGTDIGNDGILSVGETWTYVAVYAITQQDIDNAAVVNQAIVTSEIIDSEIPVSDLSDDDSFLDDEPTRTAVPDDSCTDGSASIGLIKEGLVVDIDADGCVDSILYTFTVTNNGDVDLDEVTLEDDLLGGEVPGPVDGTDIGNDGILSVGETWTYVAVYAITQADIDATVVVNQATVTAEPVDADQLVIDQSDDDSNFENSPTRTEVPDDACTDGSASIGLIKEGVVVDIDADGCFESVLYTFTVTNNGDVDLDEVTLEDDLLDGEVPGPVDGTDTGNDGILSVGETWTYQAIYAITQQDIDNQSVINQAIISAEPIGLNNQVFDLSDNDSLLENEPTRTPVPDDSCTDGSASIGLVKEGIVIDIDEDGCLESILYTFTVTNNGDVDLDEVTLEDNLLDGEVPGPVDGTDTGNDGILSVGETWTYQAIYAITQQDIDNQSVINQATVSAEPIGLNNQVFDLSDNDNLLENEPTRTPVPDDACTEGSASIGLVKVGEIIDINNDGCADTIRYTFTLTNTGSADIDEITLEDVLFLGEVPGPQSESIEENGVLQVNETWIYVTLYGLTQEDIDNASVINQAMVNGEIINTEVTVSDLSHDVSLDEDGPTLTLVPNDACPGDGGGDGTPLFGVAVIKTGVGQDDDFDGCDDSIEYTFTVINSGTTNLENVVLEDDMLGGEIIGLVATDETEDGILQFGEEWTYTATYNLTQEDLDGIFIENQALATANLVGSDDQVFDFSDDTSYQENDMTVTNVSNFCEFDENNTEFKIYNGITPNGDGFNDYFRIQGIENYPDNNLKIFNRWGVQVYGSDNYGQGNNLFRGVSEARATIDKSRELPSGTYFYILTFADENPGSDTYSGYLYINRD
ncbi:gliding motility-associated C-terminal domain-containing protein [Flagellimonas sp.]|uniref:gliding motility-associated C-terminal domain-containing protein n=1 Tax=Flagellimonas sp. TaxID=2058762 RepID=UPI003BAABFD0